MSSFYPSHPASKVVEHPLSLTSLSRTHHQLHLAGEQFTTAHDSFGRDVGNIQSRPLETGPKLPLPATTHAPIPSSSPSLLVSSTDPITTMAQLDQGVVEGYQADPDQTIETVAASPPPPPTKNPSSPAVPLSKRLFHAFVHKPTLSRTWEKKSFMDDEKKSAPPSMGGGESLERDDHDLDRCISLCKVQVQVQV
ncbi:hypothetical protein I309_04828 [Cryptococcus deuterogattii LA55]|nr:hypothetical protein I309_04828 [Cryptococcus deuterogattii LA55]KIR92053.1 hypothetical protein I304_04220 [Cryptococcus deuterogattii CBS 10090]